MNYKRKWYKNIDVLFWFLVMALVFLIPLIHFIGYHLAFNSGISTSADLTSYQNNVNSSYFYYLQYYCENLFEKISFGFLNTMFSNLWDLIGVTDYQLLGVVFGYMCSVQFMHLCFDFICWLPKLADKYLHRFEE